MEHVYTAFVPKGIGNQWSDIQILCEVNGHFLCLCVSGVGHDTWYMESVCRMMNMFVYMHVYCVLMTSQPFLDHTCVCVLLMCIHACMAACT